MRVDRIDLASVTQIDAAGVDLGRIAIEQYQVGIVRPSSCDAMAPMPALAEA